MQTTVGFDSSVILLHDNSAITQLKSCLKNVKPTWETPDYQRDYRDSKTLMQYFNMYKQHIQTNIYTYETYWELV